jgi:hypothetical protein
MKNPESNRIAEVGSQGRSMTWGESLQCQIVWVGVSQCPTGGWRKHQGTEQSAQMYSTVRHEQSFKIRAGFPIYVLLLCGLYIEQ